MFWKTWLRLLILDDVSERSYPSNCWFLPGRGRHATDARSHGAAGYEKAIGEFDSWHRRFTVPHIRRVRTTPEHALLQGYLQLRAQTGKCEYLSASRTWLVLAPQAIVHPRTSLTNRVCLCSLTRHDHAESLESRPEQGMFDIHADLAMRLYEKLHAWSQ